MKREYLVSIMLLAILLFSPSIEAQDNDSILFNITNLYLPKNETYSRQVTLVPYAPHDIEWQVSQVNITTSKRLVTIWLSSDDGSFGINVYHDTLHRNISYTPRTSDFNLAIKNEGYADIFINFTITQTGDPITAFYSPEDIMSEAIVPSIIIVIIPITITIVSIALYRRLRFSDIVAGKMNINAKIVAYAMTGIALINPQYFHVGSDPFNPLEFEISGVFWRFHSNVIPPFMFGLFGDSITTLLGLLFSYEMYRCYQARSTRKRAVIVGLLSLIWQIAPAILSRIFYPIDPSSPFFFFSGPIPFLLVIGLTMLFLLPPPEPPKMWDEGVEHTYEE